MEKTKKNLGLVALGVLVLVCTLSTRLTAQIAGTYEYEVHDFQGTFPGTFVNIAIGGDTTQHYTGDFTITLHSPGTLVLYFGGNAGTSDDSARGTLQLDVNCQLFTDLGVTPGVMQMVESGPLVGNAIDSAVSWVSIANGTFPFTSQVGGHVAPYASVNNTWNFYGSAAQRSIYIYYDQFTDNFGGSGDVLDSVMQWSYPSASPGITLTLPAQLGGDVIELVDGAGTITIARRATSVPSLKTPVLMVLIGLLLVTGMIWLFRKRPTAAA